MNLILSLFLYYVIKLIFLTHLPQYVFFIIVVNLRMTYPRSKHVLDTKYSKCLLLYQHIHK